MWRFLADGMCQSFEKWGEVSGSASAQLADLYPIMQKLPRIIAPNVRYAEQLHKVEKRLYVSHWLRAKQGLDEGTGLVRLPSWPASPISKIRRD